jgi:uncharacterized repeat protein (TIGR01451 family)
LQNAFSHELSMNTNRASQTRIRLACLLLLAGGLLLAANLGAAGRRGSAAQEANASSVLQPIKAGSAQAMDAPFSDAELIGGNFPISTAASVQGNPKTACDAATNECLVVWYDTRDSGASDIYGQRVGEDGTMLGTNFAIAAAANIQTNPDVAWNAAMNEYLVVWEDSRSGTGSDIYGQRVGRNGILLGSNFVIAAAADSQRYVAVACNATSNEYLVVWQDHRSDPNGDIYGQRVSGSGALLGGGLAVSAGAATQWYPDVACSATTSEYLVVWENDTGSGTYDDIYGQRVSGSGGLHGNTFAISTASRWQSEPAIAWNSAANEYLVAWYDSRSGPSYIYGQRVAANSALLGGNFAVGATEGQYSPDVDWNTEMNEYLVVWRQYDGREYSYVFGQRVDPTGGLLSGNFSVITRADKYEYPAVAWNAATNEYLVAYEDPGDGLYTDIFGQRIGYPLPPTPTPTPTNTPSATCTPTPTPTSTPQVEFVKAVDRGHANPGDLLAYAVSLDNRKPVAASLHLTDTLPAQLSFVDGSLTGPATYSSTLNAVLWEGSLAAGATQQFDFQARVSDAVSNTLVVNRAWLDDGLGLRSALAMTQIGRAYLYLPLILRRYPPIPDAPVLGAITAPGASPSYTVSWSTAYLADSYVLEQATGAAFSDATQVYTGPATSTVIPSQGIATYHFRVKAHNAWGGSPWSNVQAVDVRWEQEPNYPYALANGPLVSGVDYYGFPDDNRDYFILQTAQAGQITLDLTNHTGQDVQLLLYHPALVEVAKVADAPYHLTYSGEAGTYYVQIYSIGGYNTNTPYTLRATFP